MEADWEVEIGPGSPVIDANWTGYVDLRQAPVAARQLPEVGLLPGLDEALIHLNGARSPVWTAKCDVWQLTADEFDADEMDASIENALCGWGFYTDLLPATSLQWVSPATAISWCRSACDLLRQIPVSGCRADMIVRQALVTHTSLEIGVTAYLTSCGPTFQDANQVLQAGLNYFVDALCGPSKIE